jgi:prepilin-type N-terminal cleavage/methylation domain-containing protein
MKKKAFTLIEVIIAVSILAILASLVLVNFTTTRRTSRDARRRSDVTEYARALQAYHITKSTYFVPYTGVEGNGYGQINKIGSTESGVQYTSISIAKALVESGYITTAGQDPLADPNAKTDQRDYIVVRCNKDGSQNTSRNDVAFAVWTLLENGQHLRVDDRANTRLSCGSSATAPNQFFFGYSTDLNANTPIPAPVPGSDIENKASYFATSGGETLTGASGTPNPSPPPPPSPSPSPSPSPGGSPPPPVPPIFLLQGRP